jgi:Ala-tRNA(Pro) deacylase
MNACLERIERDFARHGAPLEIIKHAPAVTSQETAAAEHVSGHHLVKTVIAIVDGAPAVLGLQASREVDFDALRRELGANEVRLAREEEFTPLFPDCEVGAMPPLSGPGGLPLYLDEGVLGITSASVRGRSVEASISPSTPLRQRQTA